MNKKKDLLSIEKIIFRKDKGELLSKSMVIYRIIIDVKLTFKIIQLFSYFPLSFHA
jgi:hypothetical protein